jgi:diadenosine tetraphosphate (Ap4A) HIT family hydrolase
MSIIEERIATNRAGTNPTLICKMPSGWVVLSDQQYLPGYCILLADPIVSSLNELDPNQRAQYLCDMALVGDALLKVTDAIRINYAILGNSDPFLHAHIVPRYAWEPDEFRKNTPWSYGKEAMNKRMFTTARDKELMERIAGEIRVLEKNEQR